MSLLNESIPPQRQKQFVHLVSNGLDVGVGGGHAEELDAAVVVGDGLDLDGEAGVEAGEGFFQALGGVGADEFVVDADPFGEDAGTGHAGGVGPLGL